MEHELIIFVAFSGLQIIFHNLHKISKVSLCKRLSQYHWIVWLVNPTIIDGVHEYIIHIIVYSGYILHH